MRKMVVVDAKQCMACCTCEIECALAHSESRDLSEVMSKENPRLNVEGNLEFWAPLMCRHCEDAPCIKICPTRALYRIDPQGPVLLAQESCIGCNFCIAVCPFGVISPSADGRKVIKCDLCSERLEAGQQPACVASCPMEALHFVEVDQYVRDKRRDALRRYLEDSQK